MTTPRPRNFRVPLPAGNRIPFDPVQLVNAAVAAGRVHPRNKDAWLVRLAQGGTAAAGAYMDLLRLFPADPVTRASWQVRASGAATPGDDDEDALYESVYPSNETAAAMLERRDRTSGRDAARFQVMQNRFDNTLMAAGGPGSPADDGSPADPGGGDHAVEPDHAAMFVQHAHEHASYQGGRHSHEHVHVNDGSHEPRANVHDHTGGGDPVAAGIAAKARARAAAGNPYPAGSDEVLYWELFGD